MGDGTTLLFGLDGFRVVSVSRSPIGVRQVLIEGVSQEQACPNCGVFSTRVHGRWTQRVKDLPHGAPLEVSWDKRRYACGEGSCRRRTFTEVTAQLGRARAAGSRYGCAAGWRPQSPVGPARSPTWPGSTPCRGGRRTRR